MASLTSGNFHLEFNIHPIADPVHDGWHTYSIRLRNSSTGEEVALLPSSANPLYLNCSFMPEIPMLCSGIQTIMEKGGELTFQPIDDKDFTLKVWADKGGVTVQLTWDSRASGKDLGWPSGVPVKKQELSEFTQQLATQYAAIVG